MRPSETVSVILPAKNEKDNVVPLIRAIGEELAAHQYEIVVVDEESADGTYEAVASLGDPRVRVFSRRGQGLAGAVGFGLAQALGDILVVMDSDFDHDPRCLKALLRGLEGFDCVSVSRFCGSYAFWLRPRQVLSWAFNWAVRRATSIAVTDSLYGFFAIRRRALKACPFRDIFFGHGDYGMRLQYFLRKNNISVLEIPAIPGRRRHGRGRGRVVRTFFQYLGALSALRALEARSTDA